ncbi:ATP-binding protein [Streptomyces sp. NPDC087420]|uniref:ATP-binding protein n=1 Tax=Streptomyces sp. NPDC087420 TaxID=3365785 RepID=UPI003832A2BA
MSDPRAETRTTTRRRVLTIASAVGAPAYSETFPRLPESVVPARNLVRAALDTWHLQEFCYSATLIVDELVANAAQHARAKSIRVTITRTAERTVRVAVVDKDHKLPTPHEAGPDEEHGRGLTIVAGLSAEWGVDPLRWGKRVWADVEDV